MKPPEARPDAAPSPGEDLSRTIEQAKQQLEHMIDLNPQVMLLVDRESRVVRANKALLALLGLQSFPEVLKRPLSDLFPRSDRRFFEGLTARTGGYSVCETSADLPRGKSRQIRFTIVSSGKDSDLYVLILHDITAESEEEKRTEKEYKRQAVETLMGALMHSINQPLTVIMLRVQLMLLAVEQGTVNAAEFSQSLQDIMLLTTQIAQTLQHIREPSDYVTKPYMDGVDILDLERSGSAGGLQSYSRILLDAFMVALEAHSPGSEQHARRSAEFAACLAGHLKMDAGDIEAAQRSGFWHDIGKIGVPDRILQKPEALTPEEMKVMRRHPEIGYDLLRGFPFLQVEAQAAYAHHEHFDGSGYPRKIKGMDIPLMARIVAVAEVYDTLRSRRTYQAALSHQEAEKRILSSSGSQFDPGIVELFKTHAAEFNRLFESDGR